MEKIGIVIALKREAGGFFDLLPGKQILQKPYPVFETELGNAKIFIAISGLGKAYASACTQFVIDRYDVDLIANTGSCGGVCPKITVGDIICPYAIMEYDFKSIRLGTPVFHLNKKFIEIAENFGLKTAFLGSADSNADSEGKKNSLHQMGIEIADWESAGVIKTAVKNNKPVIILKVVTDTSSNNFVEEFLQNVKKLNYKLAKETISVLSYITTSHSHSHHAD
ncbi:MAG: 5'-methylthioadenosine/S-adenosylhomocysteine nucleosidase [Proteobacteria bacterium]|nr:5'-methylthioadenosine/S-adenosylhomocysteine nucleosidase [Pseudomonadota bacterium]